MGELKGYVVRYVDGDKTFEVTPPTMVAAVRSVRELPAFDARIFAVAEDGTETPQPTYEEALARLAQIDAALTGAFAIVPCNNNQPRVFIRGACVELVRHRRALADMRLPDNVADAEAILASAVTALQTALGEEPFHASRMDRDLQSYPQGQALNVVPELADDVDEHRATKEKLADADKCIAAQDEEIERLTLENAALAHAVAPRVLEHPVMPGAVAVTLFLDVTSGTARVGWRRTADGPWFPEGVAQDAALRTVDSIALDARAAALIETVEWLRGRGEAAERDANGLYAEALFRASDELEVWIEAGSPKVETAHAIHTILAALRAEVDAAVAWQKPGGMRPNYPPDLAGCPPSALAAMRRMLGGAK
jgi:hypothetical protein